MLQPSSKLVKFLKKTCILRDPLQDDFSCFLYCTVYYYILSPSPFSDLQSSVAPQRSIRVPSTSTPLSSGTGEPWTAADRDSRSPKTFPPTEISRQIPGLAGGSFFLTPGLSPSPSPPPPGLPGVGGPFSSAAIDALQKTPLGCMMSTPFVVSPSTS